MNDIQILMPGLCFYHEKSNNAFYVGSSTHLTANMLRKVVINGQPMTESHHTLYTNLIPISIDEETLINDFGFLPSDRSGFVFKELIKPIDVLRGDTMERVKAATNLVVECDNSPRKTVYVECGDSRVYLPEISFVHELQFLVYTHTWKFPIITITKTKTKNNESEQN